MHQKYTLRNLDCANCAAKIETHLKTLPDIKDASVNFATLTLHIDAKDIEAVRREVRRIEPDVELELFRSVTDAESDDSKGDHYPKKDIFLFSIALVLFLCLIFFEKQLHETPFGFGEWVVSLCAYLLVGWNVVRGAFRTISKGRMFDENVLMTIATLGAFGIHAVAEAVGVMLFFKVGEYLQGLAVARSRRSIRALLKMRPEYANLETNEGSRRVSPESVQPGEMILVRAGEKIPLDGIVEKGSSLVNTSALTGESVPTTITVGDVVLAGEINTTGLLIVKVTKSYADSSIAKILHLVENATARKAQTEQFITRFARYYTPAVVALALCVAVLPPLLVSGQVFSAWLYRALVLLVISCPCALLISIPLGYFGGIGGAARRGILVKGSNFIDALAGAHTVVFDKTGTLTKGTFRVKNVVAKNGHTKEQILSLAAMAEAHSNHPIARSIVDNVATTTPDKILSHEEIAGFGVIARTLENLIVVGNDAILHREHITHDDCGIAETVVHVGVNGIHAGYIVLGDELKEDSVQAIAMLRKEGVRSVVMLTGDNHAAAAFVAGKLGITEFHAGLLPEDKVVSFEKILERKAQAGTVVFVGDGINDAPVLARADVGIAMGAFGSDAAIETADVVLMTDHPSKVAEAIRIGKRTRAIVWQNIIFALGIKTIFVGLGACGMAGMWEAVFADMGTALLAVLNATRALGRSA